MGGDSSWIPYAREDAKKLKREKMHLDFIGVHHPKSPPIPNLLLFPVSMKLRHHVKKREKWQLDRVRVNPPLIPTRKPISRVDEAAPTLTVDQATEPDFQFFCDHPDEEQYIRQFVPGEFGKKDLAPIPPGFRYATIVACEHFLKLIARRAPPSWCGLPL
jgi:hypothetical protein